MNTKQPIDQLAAVDEAKRELRNIPIPWFEFELAAVEVSKANPNANGRHLVKLIMTATLEHWSTGMG